MILLRKLAATRDVFVADEPFYSTLGELAAVQPGLPGPAIVIP